MDTLILELNKEMDRTIEQQWLSFFQQSAAKYNIPEAALHAIVSRETNTRNILGDGGHGHGLGQIDDRYHKTFLQEHQNGLDPQTNIDETANIFNQFLLHYDRDYHKAFAAYNAGIGGVDRAIAQGLGPDGHTTGKNYGADTVARMNIFYNILEERGL